MIDPTVAACEGCGTPYGDFTALNETPKGLVGEGRCPECGEKFSQVVPRTLDIQSCDMTHGLVGRGRETRV